MAAWELSPGEMANACTRAVENAESPAVALDSRALAYLRQDWIGQALSDIEQALALNPLQNESLLLRGLILEAQEQASGMGDIEAALALDASLVVQYGKYGFALPR